MIVAGLAAGPMVGEHEVAGSFADGLILTLVFVALIAICFRISIDTDAAANA
ncbi:TPA: hypothetical protein R4K21_000657 [Stenotrophomonas maltophilia]|nr:hypothetical protein [Stenotrophomonas maltophilia]